MALKAKAFAYLRVSSVGQVDGDGFRRQAEAIARYTRSAGYDVVRTFEEPISGMSDLEARPALLEALNAIAGNGVRVVLVEHADRIARDAFVQESIIRQFKALGARLVTAEGIDLTDDAEPSRVMIRQIMGAVAQHDKQRLVLKLKASRLAKRNERGYCEGRTPYGWKAGERLILDRMLDYSKRAWSYGRIARTLNAEGVRNRDGHEWSASRVQAIVKRAIAIQRVTRGIRRS